jgi:ribose transport system substrate-binding protein
MRKVLLCLMILVMSISMIVTFSLSGCKKEAAPEEVAPAEEVKEEPAEEVPSVYDLGPDNIPSGWVLPETVGHVTNYLVHEWYQNLTKGEGVRADEYGIEFSINDANLDLQKSLAALDDYVAKGTDVIVFTPVNEEASGPAVLNAREKGALVIGESSPCDGMITLVSIDDYSAGYKTGIAAGEYMEENFSGKDVLILDITLFVLTTCVNRSDGFFDGLRSVIPDAERVQVDGQGLKDEAVKVSADAITANPGINVIFGINDDSALGGLQAWRAAGLSDDGVLVVGFGFEGGAGKSAIMEGGPYKLSAAMFPEYQGRLLIDAAVMALNGVKLPEHVVAPTLAMTKELLPNYYTKEGDEWVINFDTVAKISTEGEK